MNSLIIILGGPKKSLLERIRFSQRELPVDDSDVLFTSYSEDLEFFLKNIGEPFSQIFNQETDFIPSHDTWTNIKNTKGVWEQYDKIYIATEKYHGIRTKRLFKFFGRTTGIQIYDTGGKESRNARLLCLFYSTRLCARCMSFIARIFRFNKKIY